jgi:alkylhydroperoxidase family enzyme
MSSLITSGAAILASRVYCAREDYARVSLSPADQAMLDYVAKLTRTPTAVTAADIRALREVGFDDRAILDIAQITRLADGLGCGTGRLLEMK